MKRILSVIFLISYAHTEENKPIDYFMLNEAKITEIRVNEDPYSGFQPFYLIHYTTTNTFEAATPILKRNDGRVIIPCEKDCMVYYACPFRSKGNADGENIGKIKNKLDHSIQPGDSLLARKVKRKNLFIKGQHFNTKIEDYSRPVYDIDAYNDRCESQVMPKVRQVRQIDDSATLYQIIFHVLSIEPVVMAEVLYDKIARMPIYTRHIVHGASLTAAPILVDSKETIFFNRDSLFDRSLVSTADSYSHAYLKLSNLKEIKEQLGELQEINAIMKFARAQLIPDYDMVLNSWQDVGHFFITMAPMWEDIYLSLWLDVESTIRYAAFALQQNLTIYSGVFGILTTVQGTAIYLLGNDQVPVPELFWKLIINETSGEQIVIIVRNISLVHQIRNIFVQTTPICETPCSKYLWDQFEPYEAEGLIYCCSAERFINVTGFKADGNLSLKSETFYFYT